MTKLKLGPIADDKPVKVTLELPASLHRDLADEAYRLDPATGVEQRVDLWLCTWPTTIKAAPPWMARRLGPSPAIDPETDCANCAARNAG